MPPLVETGPGPAWARRRSAEVRAASRGHVPRPCAGGATRVRAGPQGRPLKAMYCGEPALGGGQKPPGPEKLVEGTRWRASGELSQGPRRESSGRTAGGERDGPSWARTHPPGAVVTWRGGLWLVGPAASAGTAPRSLLRRPEMQVEELGGPVPLGGEPGAARRAPSGPSKRVVETRPAASATGQAGPTRNRPVRQSLGAAGRGELVLQPGQAWLRAPPSGGPRCESRSSARTGLARGGETTRGRRRAGGSEGETPPGPRRELTGRTAGGERDGPGWARAHLPGAAVAWRGG
jgi:hypothetical protein